MTNEIEPINEETDLYETIKQLTKIVCAQSVMLGEIKYKLDLAEKRNSILISLEEKTDDNMKRLNNMMLELKGLACAIRPQVKKSGWYGDELLTKEKPKEDNTITWLVKELPLNETSK
jgi:hypothetical protein